jgi:hypothetical protein
VYLRIASYPTVFMTHFWIQGIYIYICVCVCVYWKWIIVCKFSQNCIRYEINSDVLHPVAFEMNSVRIKGPSNTVNINTVAQWPATGLKVT